jgi:hypothetical protein
MVDTKADMVIVALIHVVEADMADMVDTDMELLLS